MVHLRQTLPRWSSAALVAWLASQGCGGHSVGRGAGSDAERGGTAVSADSGGHRPAIADGQGGTGQGGTGQGGAGASAKGGTESFGGTEAGGRSGTGGTLAASGAGGAAPASGAGGDDGFPWPTQRPGRGVVSEIDPWDAIQPGCCSRVPGSSAATTCEPGDDSREVVFFEGTGDVPIAETRVQSKVILEHSVWLQVRTQHSAELGVIRTSVPPPKNIIDLSPVYWIGANGPWPSELHVGLPANSGAGIGTLQPGARRVQVYYSTDGMDYVGLTTDNLVTPAMAFIKGPGFLVAGAGPDTITCD